MVNPKKQSKSQLKIILWVLVGAFIILAIITSIFPQNKNQEKIIQTPTPQDNQSKNFEVDNEYAFNLCVKESNFPDLDWSQNELISKSSNYTPRLDNSKRLVEDESTPVHYYSWFSWSNVYSKDRAMHCHFITDMKTQESKIIWLWYADLEHQGGVHNVIGTQEEYVNLTTN